MKKKIKVKIKYIKNQIKRFIARHRRKESSLIEKIANREGNWISCDEFVNSVKEKVLSKDKIRVAEIGVDIGASAVPVIQILRENDEYYFFDIDDKVEILLKDFNKINSNNVNIYGFGNSQKTHDSYAWNLMKLFLDEKRQDNKLLFDVVYLDGAHTYLHDMAAASLLKEMMEIGGLLIFDDLNWSIMGSPKCNPSNNPGITKFFTNEQLEACHIGMITRCIMDTDNRYEIVEKNNNRAIYTRIR